MVDFKEKKITLPKIHMKNHVPRYKERKTPDVFGDCLHSIWCYVGGIGKGKTYSIIKNILIMDTTHTFDRYFWISPTIARDDKRMDLPEKTTLVSEYSDKWLNETRQWMLHEIDEYIKYEEYFKVFQKIIIEGKQPSMAEMMLLQMHNFEKPHTEYKWGFPSFCIVVDDLVAEKQIFSPTCKGPFSKFLTSIRHHSVSVYLGSQVLKGSLPLALRGGNVAYWCLYETSSQKLRKTISEELANNCKNIELFDQIWEKSTEGYHDFLFVNNNEKDKKLMFRRNYDNQLIIPEINDKKIKLTDDEVQDIVQK
ncbi:MAG: hypothetical protein EOP34_03470 [Rickettsiales bacterium]|nr:MAG: hypothetical protein EOP34_03470 [Rickettsiales bacterium]